MGLADLERQAAILDYLRKNQRATVSELSELFISSKSTIRRDLARLEEQDYIYKTYGGAVLTQTTQTELNHHDRLSRHLREKKKIAAYAASLIEPNYSVLLDSGTTVLQMLDYIKDIERVTIVTNGLNIANKLITKPGINLYLLGGRLRPQSQDLFGPVLMSSLPNFAVEIAFLSVDGFHPRRGLSASDHSTAEVVRGMLKVAKKRIVLADSSKGGRRAFAQICDFEDIDMIISDSNLEPEIVEDLRAMNVTVHLV